MEPDPDAEKVDLRHQTANEQKNAEEWMVVDVLRYAGALLGAWQAQCILDMGPPSAAPDVHSGSGRSSSKSDALPQRQEVLHLCEIIPTLQVL